MQDGWPAWAQRAWRSLTPSQAARARTVWTVLARQFDGVLVRPAALVRYLVDEQEMGHRSTLETIALLVQEGLVQARTAAEGTVLWIPEGLMPDDVPAPRSDPTRPSFLVTDRSNGTEDALRAKT